MNQLIFNIISLAALIAQVKSSGVVDPPADGPCCQAIPFIAGENVMNMDDLEEFQVPDIAACCDTCREYEGCLSYIFWIVDDEAGVCYLFNEAHDYSNPEAIPFPIYTGNVINPGDDTCTSVECTSEVDIFVVLDKSASVHENDDHDLTTRILGDVLGRHYFGDDTLGTRASVTMFGSSAKKLIRLNSPKATDQEAILNAITFEEQPNLGWTDLAKSLRYIQRKEFPKSRPEAQKLILIVSDGRIVKNTGSAKRELRKARQVLAKISNTYDKVSVYSIGVGNLNLDNLLQLSTPHPFLDGLIGQGPVVFPIAEMVEKPEDEGYTKFLIDTMICSTNNFVEQLAFGGAKSLPKSLAKRAKKQSKLGTIFDRISASLYKGA